MQDDESYHQAKYDQTDIANTWDMMMTQKHQMWENQHSAHDMIAELEKSEIIY